MNYIITALAVAAVGIETWGTFFGHHVWVAPAALTALALLCIIYLIYLKVDSPEVSAE